MTLLMSNWCGVCGRLDDCAEFPGLKVCIDCMGSAVDESTGFRLMSDDDLNKLNETAKLRGYMDGCAKTLETMSTDAIKAELWKRAKREEPKVQRKKVSK